MKYLSLFSGIGGFELGIQQSYEELYNLRPNELDNSKRPTKLYDIKNELQQWECVGYSEIDKYAIQIYEKHFNHKNYGDITKIIAKELPDFDLIVGGFPCQSFSIAGKRLGFKDTRGTLFFDIARIIKEKRPKYLLLENVKGLLSHDDGRTFKTILSTLTEMGYDLQWQVLNSKNFGVPQNRERVFIVGHLRGEPRPKVFPIGESDSSPIKQQFNSENKESEIAQTITATYWKGEKGSHIQQLNQPTHSNNRVYSEKGLSPTLNTAQGGNRQPLVPSKSVIRRLTPTECERLQGFPDNWTEGVSDTQRYKTLGNAVTVNVIREIISRLGLTRY